MSKRSKLNTATGFKNLPPTLWSKLLELSTTQFAPMSVAPSVDSILDKASRYDIYTALGKPKDFFNSTSSGYYEKRFPESDPNKRNRQGIPFSQMLVPGQNIGLGLLDLLSRAFYTSSYKPNDIELATQAPYSPNGQTGNRSQSDIQINTGKSETSSEWSESAGHELTHAAVAPTLSETPLAGSNLIRAIESLQKKTGKKPEDISWSSVMAEYLNNPGEVLARLIGMFSSNTNNP